MHATKVCKSSITMSLIKIIFAMRNTAFIKGNDKVKQITMDLKESDVESLL